MNRDRGPLPLLVSGLLLLSAVVMLYQGIIHRQGGVFSYILDDPYIHVAIAKNLSQHGVWGVTPHSFSSASSSVLWTGILGLGFLATGPWLLLPLLINTGLAFVLLWYIHRLLLALQVGFGPRLGVLVLVILGGPLPALIFSGQEHVAHTLAMTAFLNAFVRALDAESQTGFERIVLVFWGMMLCLARYESLFGVYVAVLLLLKQKKNGTAFALGAASVFPLVLFAAYSMSQGGLPLPNSVLLKGNNHDLASGGGIVFFFGGKIIESLFKTPELFFLIVLNTVLAVRKKTQGPEKNWPLLFVWFVAFLSLHLQFAKVGSFFRYEAYLVVSGLVLPWYLGCEEFLRSSQKRDRLIKMVLFFLMISGLWGRIDQGNRLIPLCSQNVFQQQVQMAEFIHEYYDGKGVVLNDIGAATFYNDIRLMDVLGLGDTAVTRSLRAGTHRFPQIAREAGERNLEVAIVYDELLGMLGGPPKEWTKAGEWEIPNNVICSYAKIGFYAISPTEIEPLRSHLKAFEPRLPAGVSSKVF